MREEEKTFYNCEDRIDRIIEVQLLLLLPPVSWIALIDSPSGESEEKKGTIFDFLLGLLVMVVAYLLTFLTGGILCLKQLVDCSSNSTSLAVFIGTLTIMTSIVDIFLYLVCYTLRKVVQN